MSEQKHTPGPWRTEVDIFRERLEIRSEDGNRIAVCMHDFPMSMQTHDANANLIAAAPEMLAELEAQRRACKWMPEAPDCSDADCTNQDSCSILKVISKAKGQRNAGHKKITGN